jgi:hypothetical protein
MLEDYDYFTNKRPDRTYISKSITGFDPDRVRIISKVVDSQECSEFARVKNEVVLRVSPGEREEIKAVFYEDNREIKSLTIQRFTRKNGNPHKISFTFQGEEIAKLYEFIRLIKYVHLDGEDKVRLDDEILDELIISLEDKRKFLLENLDLVAEIAQNEVTKSDIVGLAYRKQQLDVFRRLLEDDDYFQKIKHEWGLRGPEAVWQTFFEKNPWIFGYGLSFIFTSQLTDKKLEQLVSGTFLDHSGKRVDALMKTRGFISSLCFVEIKTHTTPLLWTREPYRSECWRVSDELSGSVAQIQKTVQKAIKSIGSKIELHDGIGDPTGELAFLYQPKSFVVIGKLSEFMIPNGINEQKFSSFELFRRNLSNPEIITFDELFDRAKFIISHHETDEDDAMTQEYEASLAEDDDLPF